jgi:predicted nucleotidyltransferase
MKDKILQILSEPAVRKRLVDEFEVKFLLLFGSTAVGVRKRSSDLDFAIYFKRVLSKEDEAKLVAFLKDRLSADKLDVVCLNDASCALRYEVTQDGILIFEERDGDYLDYSTQTFKQFEEMNFLNRHYHQEKIEELREFANAQS